MFPLSRAANSPLSRNECGSCYLPLGIEKICREAILVTFRIAFDLYDFMVIVYESAKMFITAIGKRLLPYLN